MKISQTRRAGRNKGNGLHLVKPYPFSFSPFSDVGDCSFCFFNSFGMLSVMISVSYLVIIFFLNFLGTWLSFELRLVVWWCYLMSKKSSIELPLYIGSFMFCDDKMNVVGFQMLILSHLYGISTPW
jgi:hypothetical protein